MGDADADFETLVAAQQREYQAALAADSDFDVAFRLQMAEALAASLSSFPSSSSANSPPPAAAAVGGIPILPTADDNGNEDDDATFAITMQVAELERFNLERRDLVACRASLSSVARHLLVSAHDERLAREIDAMPEDEWEKFGDNVERPLPTVVDAELVTFRLYFKGMLSPDTPVIVAMVCDPANKELFTIGKPMHGFIGSRKLLEAMALIDGLNAAIALGIKRLSVFTDYVTLYNHIWGKWYCRQPRVINVVNQVQFLQSKFESCNLLLVPRSSIRIISKFAQDVMNSHNIKSARPGCSKATNEICNICLESTDSARMFAVDKCAHRFCFSCMKQHAEVKLLERIIPACPHDGCNNKLDVAQSKNFLSPKFLEMLTQTIKEESIPPAEKIYCPYSKCSALMSLKELAACPEQGSSSNATIAVGPERTCIKCGRSFCINCKVLWHWHVSLTCTQYKLRYGNQDDYVHSLARQKLWRQCMKCNHMIELAEGCYHMTCRCGFEFCYTCGKEWKNAKATCKCPLWEEQNILYDRDHGQQYEPDEDDSDDDYDYMDMNNLYHRAN